MKYVLILGLIALVGVAAGSSNCVGCSHKREGADLKKSEAVLNKSLTKLAAGDGPVYRLVKMYSASTQVVAGQRDLMNADLEDQQKKIKNCNIEILSQPWRENGIEVTFDCQGEKKVTKTHSA